MEYYTRCNAHIQTCSFLTILRNIYKMIANCLMLFNQPWSLILIRLHYFISQEKNCIPLKWLFNDRFWVICNLDPANVDLIGYKILLCCLKVFKDMEIGLIHCPVVSLEVVSIKDFEFLFVFILTDQENFFEIECRCISFE